MSKKHTTAKEFALGGLATLPASSWNDPKAAAKMVVETVARAVKESGIEITGEMVRAVAYSQNMVVLEMHRIADEMDGVDKSTGPQAAGPDTPPPVCPICKEPCNFRGPGGFVMIHAACAPKDQQP